MLASEQQRRREGGRPEAHAFGQRDKSVAAEQKFLQESHEEERQAPHQRRFHERSARERESVKFGAARQADDADYDGRGGEAPKQSFPEERAEGLAQRETKIGIQTGFKL